MPKIKTECCICGKELYRWPYSLRASDGLSYCSQKCRAISRLGIKPPNKANLAGQKFGMLTVLRDTGSRNNHTVWECQCDCGKITHVTTGSLRYGAIQSCGCLLSRRGAEHPNWKQGYHINEHGYRELPVPNSTDKHRYRVEHREVMETHLGRPLYEWEVVHHINCNKLDNRLENLAVLSRSEHAALHAAIGR